jgi:hypothetical protein
MKSLAKYWFLFAVIGILSVYVVYGQSIQDMFSSCKKNRFTYWDYCPVNDPKDCDCGQYDYELIKGTAYIYDNFGNFVKTIPNADFITPTNAKCGGNIQEASTGDFGSGNENGSYVKQRGLEACYTEYDCIWDDVMGLSGYTNQQRRLIDGTVITESIYHSSHARRQCVTDYDDPSSWPITNWAWDNVGEGDCYPSFEY